MVAEAKLSLPYAVELGKGRCDSDVLRLVVTSTGTLRHTNEACPSKESQRELRYFFPSEAAFA